MTIDPAVYDVIIRDFISIGQIRDEISKLSVKGDPVYWVSIDRLTKMGNQSPPVTIDPEILKGLPQDKIDRALAHLTESQQKYSDGKVVDRFLFTLADDPGSLVARMQTVITEEFGFTTPVTVRFRGGEADFSKKISDIDNRGDKGRILRLRGNIQYLSNPLLEVILGAYQCGNCGHVEYSRDIPGQCPDCDAKSPKWTFLEDDPQILARNYREMTLQELYEDTKGDPASIQCRLRESDVYDFQLGDRVSVLGILNTHVDEIKSKKKKFLVYHLDVIGIEKYNGNVVNLNDDDIKQIEKFGKDHQDDILDIMGGQYANGIIGHENIKKAIVLQAVSGVTEYIGSKRVRGRIHILLLGDAGEGKSQLLKANKSIVPKSYYVADASASGLTVAMVKNGDKAGIQAGVVVLANEGVACIDELDKMKDEDRIGLHVPMEQGEVAKFKLGLNVNLPADTSILASANPKFGVFDPSKAYIEQTNLSSTILNRFDLIFFIRQKSLTRDEVKDMARKILKGDFQDVDYSFMTKYIAYASKLTPVLTDGAIEEMTDFYTNIRMMRNTMQEGIPANWRTLEAIKRLAQAHAKLRLSDSVDIEDVDAIKDIAKEYLEGLNYDISQLLGVSPAKKRFISQLRDTLARGDRLDMGDIIDIATSVGLPIDQVQDGLNFLKIRGDLDERDGQFLSPKGGY